MNLRTLTFVTLFLSSLSLLGQVTQNGLLEVNGNTIQNKNGTPYSVAGNSMFWSGFQNDGGYFYETEVVNFLATNWNSGLVRAAMAVEEADGANIPPTDPTFPDALDRTPSTAVEGYLRNPQEELAKIRTIIDAAIANDMYVIVDFHSHFAHFFKDEAIAFFTTIATEYGDNDHIIYEIFNEPIGLADNRANGADSAAFSQFDQTWDQIVKPYAIDVINAIRAIDPDNMIVVGTPGFSQGVVAASNDPITASDLTLPAGASLNVAYTLHFYAGQPEHVNLRASATQAMNNGIALFVTEWGTVAASGDGQTNLSETLTWMDFLKDNNISHANWSVSDKNEGASAIQAGGRIQGLLNGNLTQSGNLVRCVIQNWDTDTFGTCDLGGGDTGGGDPTADGAIKVEVETPQGQIDPNSGANSEFRSSGLSAGTRPDGEGILTGFVSGEATVFRLNNLTAGTNFYTIKVAFSSSNAGFDMVLERDAGATFIASQAVPASGGLNQYQILTFEGIPFTGSNQEIAIAISGNPGGSINVESFTYKISSCNDGVVTTFDGVNWSPNAPTQNDIAIIDGNYNTASNGNINACMLVVNTGATLTVSDASYIETTSNITVNGALLVSNTGAVVQIDEDATVAKIGGGTINLTKTTPLLAPRDFILVSSPMDIETNGGVYAAASKVFAHIPENFVPNTDPDLSGVVANFVDDNGNNLDNLLIDNPNQMDDLFGTNNVLHPSQGFLLFPQAFNAIGSVNYEHTYSNGVLNTGVISFPTHYNGPSTENNYNLIGNPYPSAIDINAFLTENASIVNEVYFWNHFTDPDQTNPGPYILDYSMDDVSLRNNLMGIAAVNDVSNTAPNQYIVSGQGFSVFTAQSAAGNDIVFNNAMRVRDNNSSLRTNTNENKLWLRVDSNTYDIHSTTGIGFVDNATPGFDAGYDSNRLHTSLSLFSTLESGEQLVIQGREPFNPSMEIALGFSTQIEQLDTYTISIDHFEGIALKSHDLLLIDSSLGTITNLKETPYSFTATKSILQDRFTLVFERHVLDTTGLSLEESIRIFPNPATENVTLSYTGAENLTKAVVTGLDGSIIDVFDLSTFNTSEILDLSTIASGIYFLTVEGKTNAVTKKLIIK